MGEDLSELGPGLHVYTAVAAFEHAGRLATELRGDLCVTVAEAEAVLVARRALPSLPADDLAELRTLADRIVTADRIVGETRMRAAADVAERLAETGAGMAIHPVTIRERADALVRAQLELAQADQLLAAHDVTAAEEAARAAAVAAEPSRIPAMTASARAAHAALEQVPKRGFLARFRRVSLDDDVEDTSASSDILRQMAAATDEAFGARRAAGVRDDQRTLLEARRSSADERVRVATRSWQELAGEDIGPDDVEVVVRRFDPQHQEALLVADDTVHVRSVNRLLQNAVERWLSAWARLDLEAPPPALARTVLEELARALRRPIVLVSAAIDQAQVLSEALPAAPVVVVEDADDVGPDATMPEPEGSGTEETLEADR